MGTRLDLQLFQDEGYRFNDDMTPSMADAELRRYLLQSAIEYRDIGEPEIEYGILRELIWRFPNSSAEAWKMMSRSAQMLGKTEEALAAGINYQRLTVASDK